VYIDVAKQSAERRQYHSARLTDNAAKSRAVAARAHKSTVRYCYSNSVCLYLSFRPFFMRRYCAKATEWITQSKKKTVKSG